MRKREEVHVGALAICASVVMLLATIGYRLVVPGGGWSETLGVIEMMGLALLYVGIMGMIKRKTYADAWGTLKRAKGFTLCIFAIFAVSAVVGFAFAPYFSFVEEVIRGLIANTQGMPALLLIQFIFLNNVQSSFSGFVFGVFFGIVPVFVTLLNGVVVGYVLNISWQLSGMHDFWRLLPHGIFELPAIFIALGLGLYNGWNFLGMHFREAIRRRIWLLSALLFFVFALGIVLYAYGSANLSANIGSGASSAEAELSVAGVLGVLGFLGMFASLAYFMVFSFAVSSLRKVYWEGVFAPSLKVFLIVVVPLLALAAVIEGVLIAVFPA